MTDQKIALVTGGAQGIGLASARALAADGFRPVLADINEDGVTEAAAALGHDAAAYACDMGDPAAIAALFDTVEAEVGPASVLVNNAGVAMPGDFLDYDIETFNRVIAINLTGAFLAMQRAARTMVDRGIEGAIVNMSSINAQLAIPAIPAYCASKGGLMQLTKVAAIALAPRNIRVNANPEAYAKAMSRTPLGRPGTADEIGSVVAFLASDKASYITGETIYVDGGRLGLNYTM